MESEKVNEMSVVDAIRYIKERSKKIQHTAQGILIALFDGSSLFLSHRSLIYVFFIVDSPHSKNGSIRARRDDQEHDVS